MKDLIEALQIFEKYQVETRWPTICQHDELYVVGVSAGAPSVEEKRRLNELGFIWDEGSECWMSIRFGSA